MIVTIHQPSQRPTENVPANINSIITGTKTRCSSKYKKPRCPPGRNGTASIRRSGDLGIPRRTRREMKSASVAAKNPQTPM